MVHLGKSKSVANEDAAAALREQTVYTAVEGGERADIRVTRTTLSGKPEVLNLVGTMLSFYQPGGNISKNK